MSKICTCGLVLVDALGHESGLLGVLWSNGWNRWNIYYPTYMLLPCSHCPWSLDPSRTCQHASMFTLHWLKSHSNLSSFLSPHLMFDKYSSRSPLFCSASPSLASRSIIGPLVEATNHLVLPRGTAFPLLSNHFCRSFSKFCFLWVQDLPS